MMVFYDFETTGLSPAFDQPLQFAAVLVDEELNEVESVNFRCKLSDHILPSPLALAVSRTTTDMLTDNKLPSLFEMSQKIDQVIKKWTPAFWIGYNNINFDEMFLRHLFYQNLQPTIYSTQLNGNFRADILKLIYAVYALEPRKLNWCINEVGSPTFSLECLAKENGYSVHDSHDALGDVRATLFLTNRIKNNCPTLWEYFKNCAKKSHINSLLLSGVPLTLISRHKSRKPKAVNVAYIGRNPYNNNQVAVVDLDVIMAQNFPIESLISLSDDNFFDKNSPILIPVSVNAFPYIIENRNPSKMVQEYTKKIGINSVILNRILNLFVNEQRKRSNVSKYVELQIYDNFITKSDQNILNKLQSKDWVDRKRDFELLGDRRLKLFGSRLLISEAPELLSKGFRAKCFKSIVGRWQTPRELEVPWTTFYNVKDQLERLENSKSLSTKSLTDYKAFFEERPKSLLTHLDI